MNTKHIEDRKERKEAKHKARKARNESAPKKKRAADVARGSMKKRIRRAARNVGRR